MKIPKLTFKDTNKIDQSIWESIEKLAKTQLTDTSGLIDDFKQRQRLALYQFKGEVVGVAGIDTKHEKFKGRWVYCISVKSAWTSPEWRNKNLPQSILLLCIAEAKLKHPFSSIYWFLGSTNYMSYRMLFSSFKTHWPNAQLETPAWEKACLYHLGTHFYDLDVDLIL